MTIKYITFYSTLHKLVRKCTAWWYQTVHKAVMKASLFMWRLLSSYTGDGNFGSLQLFTTVALWVFAGDDVVIVRNSMWNLCGSFQPSPDSFLANGNKNKCKWIKKKDMTQTSMMNKAFKSMIQRCHVLLPPIGKRNALPHICSQKSAVFSSKTSAGINIKWYHLNTCSSYSS